MKKVVLFYFIVIVPCLAKRFISIKLDNVNVRKGPSLEYPINFTYVIKNMPLEFIAEYGDFYKVKDKDGDEGWVSASLTSKKRYLIVKNNTQIIYKNDNVDAPLLFRVEENVVLEYIKCNKDWCKVKVNGKKGWIESVNVYGA
ncbi:MAG: SH3 domain-containing protein [Rickettsiales bacterium]|jgi:SH3-like domain-containing protein|nr:SH3 domain-containing protein [Rickettsiales bacterium]